MSNTNVTIGPGFCGTLTIVFIVLKLVGTISWSWWWVLSPIWLPVAAVLGLLGIFIIIAFIVGAIGGILALINK